MSIDLFRRRSALAGALSMVVGTVLLASAAQADLGYFESRRIVKNADQAFAGGKHDQALELYGQLIEGLQPSDSRHALALYRSALSSLASSPADYKAARQFLERLPASFKSAEGGAEAAILKRMLADRASSEQSTKAAEAALAKAEEKPADDAAREAEQEQASSTADEEMKRLRAKNSRLKAELKELKAELERKEEALEKLKEVVVGGG